MSHIGCFGKNQNSELGIPELGAVFSHNRDFALIDGFND